MATALLLMLFFESWRLILLVHSQDMAGSVPTGTLIKSFLIGARFDFRVVSAIVLPLYLLAIIPKIDISTSRTMRRVNLLILYFITGIVFLFHLIDIEFFNYFNTRLNGSALLWSDTPLASLSMIWDTYPVIWYLLLYAVILTIFILLMRWLTARIASGLGKSRFWVNMLYLPVILAIFITGMIGRLYEVAPMRWGMAYFSQYDLANQLSLNPTYTFMRDIFYDAHNRNTVAKLVEEIKVPDAEEVTREMLGAPVSPNGSPPKRMVRPVRFNQQNSDPPNVIVIIMESFAASKIGCLRSEYPYDMTLHFDTLAERGILFTNFYSAGSHTCSGLFNTLYGSSHLFGKVFMKQVGGHTHFQGLPSILRDRGYRTIFFTTQDPHFDNMQGFLMSHGMMDIYSVFDYDQDQVLSWLGVPDHIMFDYAYDKLCDQAKTGDPFMATMLTGSNHGPWFVPDVPFDPLADSVERAKEFNALKYADWALGRMINRILDDPLFSNTLIVVTADNGYKYNVTTDLDLSLLEIPLLLIDTDHADPPGVRNDRLGCQLDILPTVMGHVGLDYDNYSFGVDLLDTAAAVHDFVLATRWYEVGYIQDGYYTIMRLNGGTESIFEVSNKAVDLADTRPDLLETYTHRARAVYQSAFENYQLPLSDQ